MKNTETMEKTDVCTYECTVEKIDAARSAAHNAEVKAARKSVYVAHMQGFANYFLSELKTCKEDEKAQAEENVAKHNKALADAHAEWSALLNTAEELWTAYRDLADEFDRNRKRSLEQVLELYRCEDCSMVGCTVNHAQCEDPPKECRECGQLEDVCQLDHEDLMYAGYEPGGW